MATMTENSRRVRVQVTQAEMNTLLIQPAKERGFIDFNPTRIATKQLQSGGFEITFEQVEDVRS